MADNTALIANMKERLNNALSIEAMNIIDDSAKHIGHAGNTGGAHFTVQITSADFKSKTPIACHRMVYEPLKDLIPEKIHALSIQTYIPEE